MQKDLNTIAKVESLEKLDRPSIDEVSLNTKLIYWQIEALDFEREDGALDVFSGSSQEYEKAEARIAENILSNIKKILQDIEEGNKYRYQYCVSQIYSRLKDGTYSYRSIEKFLDAATQEEAEKLRDDIKVVTPKEHPSEPEFTLEDVRLGAEVVDSSGKKIRTE